MKKLSVTFADTVDKTGYLFSLMKCLSASLRCSGYGEFADDIVASSGFAFRMWVDPVQLCPSATSIWDFSKQKAWIENGGLICDYVERLWWEEAQEEERRKRAIFMIRRSIDAGVAPVAWDISGSEWGLITGYDDESESLLTLKIDGTEGNVAYDLLGKLDIPILSVLTVTGKSGKSAEQIVIDTKKLALSHLNGEEWCENAKGMEAYDALITFTEKKLTAETAWNIEYCLGTYGALKWYGWKFFEKYQQFPLAQLYRKVYEYWQAAFDTKCANDAVSEELKTQLIALLRQAKEAEVEAVRIMAE